MKIVDIEVILATVPMEVPLRWSKGVETGTTRGIIKVATDEGISGVGKTYGGNAVEHPFGSRDLAFSALNHSKKASCSIGWAFSA